MLVRYCILSSDLVSILKPRFLRFHGAGNSILVPTSRYQGLGTRFSGGYFRVLSSILEGLVMMAKILLSTWFERITVGANHITLTIILEEDEFGHFLVWRNLKMVRRSTMPAELERTLGYLHLSLIVPFYESSLVKFLHHRDHSFSQWDSFYSISLNGFRQSMARSKKFQTQLQFRQNKPL